LDACATLPLPATVASTFAEPLTIVAAATDSIDKASGTDLPEVDVRA
jgi:hypothetical protein